MCPGLTSYERELLKLRYVDGEKVVEIAGRYRKSKGTVSPQIARALEKFEAWCKTNEKKVSKIAEESRREAVVGSSCTITRYATLPRNVQFRRERWLVGWSISTQHFGQVGRSTLSDSRESLPHLPIE